jgi:hypothetical protein
MRERARGLLPIEHWGAILPFGIPLSLDRCGRKPDKLHQFVETTEHSFLWHQELFLPNLLFAKRLIRATSRCLIRRRFQKIRRFLGQFHHLSVHHLSVHCLSVHCLSVHCLSVHCLSVRHLSVHCLSVYHL